MGTGKRWTWVATAALAAVLLSAGVASAQEESKGGGGLGHIFWLGINETPIGWILILMSIGSTALIVEHFLTIRRPVMIPPELPALFDSWIKERQYTEMMQYLETEKSMLGQTVAAALSRSRAGFDAMREAAETLAGEKIAGLFRKVEWLNIIGNGGPLLGLMGTVIGMVLSFSEISAAKGAARPEQLAVGISLALINTFLGLFVAFPSLVAYGHFRARVDAIGNETSMLAMEILENFRPGAKSAAGGAGATTSSKAVGADASRQLTPKPVPAK
jgi:biopolymer transport protein ExbB